MTTEISSVRTINRVCDILNCFKRDEPVLSLTQIGDRLDFPKSTTHRLLTSLVDQGVLTREDNGRGYRLGYQLLRWGMLARETLDLRNDALPILESLSKTTDETAILSIRDGHEGICVEIVESTHPVRLAMQIGKRMMLHAGASAKVLWAFLPADELQNILNEIELVAFMPNTITDRATMYHELMEIRARGYATSFEETDAGAMGISAPVYGYLDIPVAGIGIAAPLSRISRDRVPEVAPLVVAAGRQLSARLGAIINCDGKKIS